MSDSTPSVLRSRLYISEWMEARKISDEQMGETLHVARQTIHRWRREQNRLTPEKIAQLALALGIAPEDLFRQPGRQSIDALLAGASDDDHAYIKKMAQGLIDRISAAKRD